MKKIIFFVAIALAVTAGGVFAQMGGGQHMMGEGQQPPQAQAQQGASGMMGGYGMQQPMMGYGMGAMYPGMMGGYGMHQPMMGYGMGGMHPGMMGGYGMHQPMMGYGMGGMYPGMTGGCGMHQPMMGGYGMHQPMMGYGKSQMHSGMMGYGMPHMYPGAGDVEKQREFLKETSKLRKKLHDLMFDHMEARWDPEAKPEQLEQLGKEMRELQQGLYEKSREALK